MVHACYLLIIKKGIRCLFIGNSDSRTLSEAFSMSWIVRYHPCVEYAIHCVQVLFIWLLKQYRLCIWRPCSLNKGRPQDCGMHCTSWVQPAWLRSSSIVQNYQISISEGYQAVNFADWLWIGWDYTSARSSVSWARQSSTHCLHLYFLHQWDLFSSQS
jgi:hypothetical protein